MLIKTPEKALKVIRKLNRFKYIIMDTETTGLEPFCGDRAIGYVLKGANSPGDETKSYYFPFRHDDGNNLPLSILEELKPLLSDPEKIYVGFNYKFDMEMAYMDGIPLPKTIEDVQILCHMMDENKKNEGLKAQGDYYLGDGQSEEEDKLVDLIIEKGYCTPAARKKAKGMMCKLTPEEVEPYACQDTDLTWNLRNFFMQEQEWDDGVYSPLGLWGLETLFEENNEYLLALTEIEILGIQMDRERIIQYMNDAEPTAEHHANKIRQMLGRPEFNPGSPTQVAAVLGIESTAKDVLDELLEDPDLSKRDRKIIEHKLEYNGWSKAVSTFFRPYLDLLDENDVMHTNYNNCGTITTRLSSNNPNLQQVPKKAKGAFYQAIKKCFVARKGYTLVSCDYQQAEIILGANYSGDKALIDIVTNGLSMHDVTAKDCGIPRDAAKTINFGVDYGMQANLLSQKLKIAFNTAVDYLDKYWKKFKGKKKLFQACMQKAEDVGYIVLWTGRILHFNTPERPSYAAMNALIQGGIAELLRVVTLRVRHWIKTLKDPDAVHILLQVHDQLVFEVKDEYLTKYIPMIVDLMEYMPTHNAEGEELPFQLSMKVDVAIGPSWGELVKWER